MNSGRTVFASHYYGAEGSEEVRAEAYAERARLEGREPETGPSEEAILAREKVRNYRPLSSMSDTEAEKTIRRIFKHLQEIE